MTASAAIQPVFNPFATAKINPEVLRLAEESRKVVKQVLKFKPVKVKPKVVGNPFATAKISPEVAALFVKTQEVQPLPVPVVQEEQSNTIHISELVDGVTAKEMVLEALKKPVEAQTDGDSTQTIKKYSKAVPEHLNGLFAVPQDINQFVVDLLPNLQVVVRAYMRNPQIDHSELINSFILYMCEIAPSINKVRWNLYNPEKFPDMPYWKWVVSHLKFFCKNINHKQNKQNQKFQSLDLDAEYDDTNRDTISEDKVSFAQACEDNCPMERAFSVEVLERLYKLSENAEKVCPGGVKFENFAYRLMELKMEGYTMADIASRIGVSQQAVWEWNKKLRRIIGRLLGEAMPEEAEECALA